jgi:capsular polysaccharide transport system permease protein
MTTKPEQARPLLATSQKLRFATPRTILALILREMASTHGRSPGGYIWMVMEPLLGIALLSAIFSLGFRSPRIGINFPIFFATGMMPFFLFMDLSGKVAQSITYSRSLLAYPRVTFVDAILARAILSVLTQVLISCIVLTGICLAFETRIVFLIDRAFIAYAMAAALGLGIGLLNCFMFTMFPLYQRAWNVLTRPLVLISGVIFLYESLPEWVQHMLWYNPLMHVTGELRGAFYLQYEAKYVNPAYVFGVALSIGLIGLVFLRRYHRDMLER